MYIYVYIYISCTKNGYISQWHIDDIRHFSCLYQPKLMWIQPSMALKGIPVIYWGSTRTCHFLLHFRAPRVKAPGIIPRQSVHEPMTLRLRFGGWG